MAWRKVSSSVVHMTYAEFRKYLAQNTGVDYLTISLAIASLGVSLVARRYINFSSDKIAKAVANTSLGISVVAALDLFLKSPNQASLEAAIRDADINSKQYMRINTEVWYYEGHSGNAFTKETRTTYTAY